jgi:hypothetical protein
MPERVVSATLSLSLVLSLSCSLCVSSLSVRRTLLCTTLRDHSRLATLDPQLSLSQTGRRACGVAYDHRGRNRARWRAALMQDHHLEVSIAKGRAARGHTPRPASSSVPPDARSLSLALCSLLSLSLAGLVDDRRVAAAGLALADEHGCARVALGDPMELI